MEIDPTIKIFKNNDGCENKLTRFRISPENPKSLFKIQNSEIFVEYEKGFDMKTGKLINNSSQPYRNRKDKTLYIPVIFPKNAENPGGKLRSEEKDSTRLQELSL